MIHLFSFLSGYALGSIPWGLLLPKMFRGIDVRQYGSGNIGASNVFRVVGPTLGVPVFILDTAKGFIPVWLSMQIIDPRVGVAAGLGALCGHILTPWLKFRGGRGVATGLGVFIGLAPAPVFLALGVWIVVLALTRYISVASMTAAVSLPILLLLGRWHDWPAIAFGALELSLVAALLVIIRHVPNIRRLVRGEESRFRFRRER
jgi:glycerol-3-phosphate acyltransferase PlsY